MAPIGRCSRRGGRSISSAGRPGEGRRAGAGCRRGRRGGTPHRPAGSSRSATVATCSARGAHAPTWPRIALIRSITSTGPDRPADAHARRRERLRDAVDEDRVLRHLGHELRRRHVLRLADAERPVDLVVHQEQRPLALLSRRRSPPRCRRRCPQRRRVDRRPRRIERGIQANEAGAGQGGLEVGEGGEEAMFRGAGDGHGRRRRAGGCSGCCSGGQRVGRRGRPGRRRCGRSRR